MRTQRITKALQTHDRELYCAKNKEGVMGVYRKGHKWISTVFEGDVFRVLKFSPHFVFALTDNWATNGRPVDWGIEPIMARIKALDLWNRDLASEIIEQNEKVDASKERDKDNNTEAFLYEFRDKFKKTFSDVRTSTLSKVDRRRDDEKKLKLKGY